MSRIKITNFVLLVLLALAAGGAKIMKLPDELQFFQQLGLGETGLVVFGIIQLVSGILMVMAKLRVLAAATLCFTFIISSVAILISGNIAFAVFSLLPIVMTGFVIKFANLAATKPDHDIRIT